MLACGRGPGELAVGWAPGDAGCGGAGDAGCRRPGDAGLLGGAW